jgi:hypothetical protein
LFARVSSLACVRGVDASNQSLRIIRVKPVKNGVELRFGTVVALLRLRRADIEEQRQAGDRQSSCRNSDCRLSSVSRVISMEY